MSHLIDASAFEAIRRHYHVPPHHNAHAPTMSLGFGLLHYALVRNLRCRRVLVVGSQRGFVPAVCGVACRDQGFGSVDFVDAGYSDSDRDSWGGVGVWQSATPEYWAPIGCQSVIRIHACRLEDFSPESAYSYCYVDADHSYEGVRRDFEFCDRALEPGGIMSFHDVSVERSGKWGEFGVRRFWEGLRSEEGFAERFEQLTLPMDAGLGLLRKRS